LVVFDARGLGDVRAAPQSAVKHHRPLHLATADAVKGAVARDGRGHGGEGIKRTGAAVQLPPPVVRDDDPVSTFAAPCAQRAHTGHGASKVQCAVAKSSSRQEQKRGARCLTSVDGGNGVVCPEHAFYNERQCCEGLKSLRVSVTGRPWALTAVTDDARLRATSRKVRRTLHGIMGCT